MTPTETNRHSDALCFVVETQGHRGIIERWLGGWRRLAVVSWWRLVAVVGLWRLVTVGVAIPTGGRGLLSRCGGRSRGRGSAAAGDWAWVRAAEIMSH